MMHMNDLGIGQTGKISTYLRLKLFCPQLYWCMSVADFVHSRQFVKPSSRFNLYLPGGAIVVFQDAYLKLIERGYEISDLSGSLVVGEYSPGANKSAQRYNLTDGRYSQMSIAYFPKTRDESAYLVSADKFEDPASEESPEEPEKILRLNLAV